MAKEKKEDAVVEEATVAVTARELAWEKFVAAYAAQNPAKYEARKAAGAFNKIPDNFVG